MNPFWHIVRILSTPLSPDECRLRLRQLPTTTDPVDRAWFGGRDGTFYIRSVRFGPLLEMHVRVSVLPGHDGPTTVRLRFSGGFGSAFVLIALQLGCLLAFSWGVLSLATGGWSWFPVAGLVSIVIPVLLVLALRASVADDIENLSRMIAGNLDA